MIYAANWKMNVNLKQAQDFLYEFEKKVKDQDKKNFIFFVPALISFLFREKNLSWGGQNVNSKLQGAFTGENSLEVLKELGASFCLLGHSERRHLFHESHDEIKNKFYLMKEMGITPVLCVGEKEEERACKTEILTKQLQDFKKEKDFIVAYEPVWSIGTGNTPAPDEINETHKFIKEFIIDTPHVLYGGSVNSENSVSFSTQKNIDGFLIGSASTKADELYNIFYGGKNS